MLTYIVRRLLLVIVVVWGAATLAFGLLYLSGDPVNLLLPLDASPEARDELRRAYGFDQPLYVQYGRYMVKLLHGDFGTSLRSEERRSTWCCSAWAQPCCWPAGACSLPSPSAFPRGCWQRYVREVSSNSLP